jgi:hypothetical protein
MDIFGWNEIERQMWEGTIFTRTASDTLSLGDKARKTWSEHGSRNFQQSIQTIRSSSDQQGNSQPSIIAEIPKIRDPGFAEGWNVFREYYLRKVRRLRKLPIIWVCLAKP